jgi:D-3-phosphoglycerate dehydrogenase / 2-oxoglutarate reductase
MRILVLGDPYCPSDALRAAFGALVPEHTVTFADVVPDHEWRPSTPSEFRLRETTGTPAQVEQLLDGHDVLVLQAAPVSEETLDRFPSLRLICCLRGGPVNVDVAAATERGIPVALTPGKNADAVAELTIAFMIMLARRMGEIARYVNAGGVVAHDNYEGRHWFGHDLAAHTLGLVGYGQVGRRVAVRAAAFGMRVLAYDPFVDPATLRESGVEPADLRELLAQSDFVSLHARATESNRGLIGRAEIASMRSGAYLINTARDALLDEEAALDAIASGRLGGLALDVPSPTPETGLHPLLAHPNVIITPHVGGATYETLAHAGEMAVNEIERFARGEALVNVADRAAVAGVRKAAAGGRQRADLG